MMLKKIGLPILASLLLQSSQGQEILKVEGLNKNGAPVSTSKPALRVSYIRNNDSCFEKLTYNNNRKGRCRSLESFNDTNFQVRHGVFVSYTDQGWVNELGFYTTGMRSGIWYRRIGVFYYAVEKYVEGNATVLDSVYINPTSKSQSFTKEKIVDATYHGGNQAFNAYLKTKIRESAFFKNDESFSALTAFFVHHTGAIMAAIVWQSNNFEIDFFVRKILMNMPAWTPAKDALTGLHRSVLYFQRISLYTE